MAVAHGRCPRGLAAPDQHVHLEGLGVAGQTLADAPVAPDAQGLAIQALAEIGLPVAGVQALDSRQQLAPGVEDQRPGQLRRGDGRAAALHHGDASGRAGVEVEMGADPAGLADQPEPRQAVQQLGIDAGPFAGQHQGVGLGETSGQLVHIALRVVEQADPMAVEQGEAVERADHLLVVVGNGDMHGLCFKGEELALELLLNGAGVSWRSAMPRACDSARRAVPAGRPSAPPAPIPPG